MNTFEAKPLSVTEFVVKLNEILSEQVIWVEGEIADLRISQGKWMNFALKDEQSLINCFAVAFKLRNKIEEGMKVKIWGVPNIYPKFGRLTLKVETVEPSGEGALKRSFELLKEKLGAEGLFAETRKRRLPRFPEKIGLITSSDAAAYSDFLKVLRARRGGMEINFMNVSVQGREAVAEIKDAIEFMNEKFSELEALVLVRGGGSLEDLHAFNDEEVVRAIARSRIPMVVGVGHERDITLADLAADLRGSTPSNSAELLTPTREELISNIFRLEQSLSFSIKEEIKLKEREVHFKVNVLRESVRKMMEKVQFLAQKMSSQGNKFIFLIEKLSTSIGQSTKLLVDSLSVSITSYTQSLNSAERVLNSLHPRKTLERGYSITRDSSGAILKDSSKIKGGEAIQTVLARGIISSTVNLSETCLKPHLTSPNHTKSSSESSPSSKQATLI